MAQLCAEAVAAAPTFEAERAIKYAFSKLGVPYSQDTTLRVTTHFDCSSFVGRAYSAAGGQVRRYNGSLVDYYYYFAWTGAYIQQGYFSSGYRYGYEGTNVSRVSAANLKPGDVIIQFNGSNPGNSAGNAGHAQIFIGNGLIIQSGGPGDGRVNVSRVGNYLQNEWFFRYNTLGAAKNPSPNPTPAPNPTTAPNPTPTPLPFPAPNPPPTAPKTFTYAPQRAAGQPSKPGGVTVLQTMPNNVMMGTATVVSPSSDGFLTAWPCSEPRPTAASAVYAGGQTKANFVFGKADSNGNMCIYNSTETHLLWDQTMSTLVMAGHSNVRKADTREQASATAGKPLGAGETLRVATGAPPGTSAVGTISAISPDNPGWAVVYTCDQPRPNSSTVNFAAGARASNTAVVTPSEGGDICIYSTVNAHFTWDQMAETITIPDAFPSRKLDTRISSPQLPEGSRTIRFRAGQPGLLTFGNLTVTSPDGQGHATLYACDTPRPNVSSINYDVNKQPSIANMAAAVTDKDGHLCVFVSGKAHVLWDQVSQTSWLKPSYAPVRTFDTRAQ